MKNRTSDQDKTKRRQMRQYSKIGYRSTLTNGNFHLLNTVDRRLMWARRFRDLVTLHADDLGGMDAISTAQLCLIKRAATLTVELEAREARFAEKDRGATDKELETYQRASNTLHRLLAGLGLERTAKVIEHNSRQSEASQYGKLLTGLRKHDAEDVDG